MKPIRQMVVILLSFALFAYAQGNSFKKIRYAGGTIETRVKPKDWKNRLTVTSELIKLELRDGQVLKIDPSKVTGLSYGQEAHRRVGTMVALGILFAPLALFGLFHKTRKHFVGIEFVNAEGKKSGLLLQAHKKNYRAVLMALRGATGAPVNVSEEDRKYLPIGVDAVIAKPKEENAPKQIDAVIAKPKEENVTSQIKKETSTGLVWVDSVPEAAEIYVDGAFVGNTPAKLPLPAGKHQIRIALLGFQDWVREIEVLSNSDVTLSAALKKL